MSTAPRSHTASPTETVPLLTAVGLERHYGTRRAPSTALHPSDLTIGREETVALVGESGSGKSTLVRQLLRLDDVASGRVEHAGRSVDEGPASLRAFRRRTGIVLQDPYSSLDPRMRVGRIVAEPLRGFGIEGDHRAIVRDALAEVGLPSDAADRYPHEFSGGQRQRIAIARAIAHGPDLLVGDEPLSALDVTVRARILALLAELRRSHGMSMLIVSHDLGVVRRISDRVVVLSEGRIVEQGATEDVLGNPQHPETRRLVAAVPTLGPVPRG